MTLATAWTQASPFGLALDPDAAKDPAALRAGVVAAHRAPHGPGCKQR